MIHELQVDRGFYRERKFVYVTLQSMYMKFLNVQCPQWKFLGTQKV